MSIFNIDNWLKWLKMEDNAFNKLPINGIVGLISNESREDILIIYRTEDAVNIRVSKIQEETRNPVVDIVFVIAYRHFDLILNSDFSQFINLVDENLITASPLISVEKLQTRNYLEFIGLAGLTIKIE